MSQTPRTDDRLSTGFCSDIALAAFTRGLERELNAEKAQTLRLREALSQLLMVSENADETGYVDGEGWLPLEEIQQKAHAALASTTVKPLSKTKQLGEPVSNADELDSLCMNWIESEGHALVWDDNTNPGVVRASDGVEFFAETLREAVIKAIQDEEPKFATKCEKVIPLADVKPLVRALENFISVGMEFYDMECGEAGGAAINQAEQALQTFTEKHGEI